MNTPQRNGHFVVFLWCSIVLTSVASVAQAQPNHVAGSGNSDRARKFDEYGNIKPDDQKARLDNFVIELQPEPTAKGYIIVYGYCAGQAQRHAEWSKDYLVNKRRIDAGRLITVDGGCKEDLVTQLWVVPSGASPPKLSTEGVISPCPACRKTPSGGTKRPSIPDFPWPPPRASARTLIPVSLLQSPGGQTLLFDVAARLQQAFNEAGYGELSWYSVPGGFAMVSRMEQFDRYGTPLPDPDRFSIAIAQPRTLGERLWEVIRARQGRFRMIVLVVTSEPVRQGARRLSREEAMELFAEGADRVPEEIGREVFSSLYLCTALIYEFHQRTPDHNAEFVPSSRLDANIHLRQAGILPALERRR